MTERKYTVDEIHRWAHDPTTALHSVLAAMDNTAAASAAMSHNVSPSGRHHPPRHERATRPTAGVAHTASARGVGPETGPEQGRTGQGSRRQVLFAVRLGLWSLEAAKYARSASSAMGSMNEEPGNSALSSPCSVCGAPSVGEPPAAGDGSATPAAGEGVSS